MSDEDCSKIVKAILLGVRHLHRNNYVHRDLKPTNVVIKDIDNLEDIKIVDFGLTITFQTRQGIDETCGTLLYQAPEQMEGGQSYGKAVDIWAIGFIMYELISGVHPLFKKGDDKLKYREKLLNSKSLQYGSCFNEFQISLIERLCHMKPSQRYNVDQALQHPWITRQFTSAIPRNHFEQNMYLNEMDEKLRKLVNIVFALSVIKNAKPKKTVKPKIVKARSDWSQRHVSPNSNKSGFAIIKNKSQNNQANRSELFEYRVEKEEEEEKMERQITPFFQIHNQGQVSPQKKQNDKYSQEKYSNHSFESDFLGKNARPLDVMNELDTFIFGN